MKWNTHDYTLTTSDVCAEAAAPRTRLRATCSQQRGCCWNCPEKSASLCLWDVKTLHLSLNHLWRITTTGPCVMLSQSQSSRVSPERPRMLSPSQRTVGRFCEDTRLDVSLWGKIRFCASFCALRGFDVNNLNLGRKDQRGLYSHLSADETVYFKSRHKCGFCLATQNESWVSNNQSENKSVYL